MGARHIIRGPRRIIRVGTGDAMFACGQEEPLHSNEQLYMLVEATGELVLSRLEDRDLNRYGFVWLGPSDDADAALARLIRTVGEATNGALTWFLVRGQQAGEMSATARLAMAKLSKTGWRVRSGNPVLASKAAGILPTDSFRPPDTTWRDGYLLLSIGSAPSVDELADAPARRTVERFAQNGHFAPSREFFSWLAARQFALGYVERDDLGRFGFVIVTPRLLPIARIRQQVDISEVRIGNEAGSIWRYPPGYSWPGSAGT